MRIDGWGDGGLLGAVVVGAVSVGLWHCSLFAGVWMRMLFLFLPVHLMVLAGLLVVLRQACAGREARDARL